MMRLEIAALYCGVNLLVLLVLSVMVAMGRRRHKIVLGTGENDAFNRAVRAHGNAAEYIPAGLVGLVVLSLFEALPLWTLHAAGASLTFGRIFHGLGLHAGPLNIGRVLGMVLTWASYLLMAGALIYVGLNHKLGA